MNAQLAHPSKAELSAFALGRLPEESSATIEHQLSECDACSATLASVADDTLIGLLVEGEDAPAAGDAWIDVRLNDTEETAAHMGTVAAGVPDELANHPRYRVVRLLGRGGMGDVYLAEHRLMERPVAIKVMKRRLMGRADAVERFRREVKAAAQLRHENIVTAYDAEQAGDLHLLVMEYVDGHDLATEVKQRGPLPVHEACEYARQAALGLAHAHAQGIVHRDIKPHNLMLVDGHVRILDFGLAQVVQAAAEVPHGTADAGASSLTGVHSVLGTPDYIAPEQIHNAHAADHRADLCSLGATLFFLLTGRPPFSEGSATERIESHLRRDPSDIREARADVPEDVAHVIRRLMAKSPSQRYPTAESVAAALAPFCREPSSATPLPTTASGSRWNWAIAPVLAAIFAGGAWGFWEIVVTIRDREGKIVSQTNVPEGGQVAIEVAEPSAEEHAIKRFRETHPSASERANRADSAPGHSSGHPGHPRPAAHPTPQTLPDSPKVLATFGPDDEPITKDGIGPAEGGWMIEVDGDRFVRLFDIESPGVEDCMLLYEAELKSENVDGRAYLEMWVRMPDGREFFSIGIERPITGTTRWASYQIPFWLPKGERPELIKLGITVEGGGSVWIRDMELKAQPASLSIWWGSDESHGESRSVRPLSREQFALRTRKGYYLRAVQGSGDGLRADAREPETSELFTLDWLDAKKSSVRLRTRDGYYVHAALGGGDDVDAIRREPGSSEAFQVEWVDRDAGKLRLRTREGFYVHPVGGGGGDVDAAVKEPGSSEVLTLVPAEKLDTTARLP